MRFKIVENLPVEIAQVLCDAGHDAITVFAQRLKGASDVRLAQCCRDENRVVVTLDLDFADIRAYAPEQYPEIIVLRTRLQDKDSMIQLIHRVIPLLAVEPLAGHLWIVETRSLRVR